MTEYYIELLHSYFLGLVAFALCLLLIIVMIATMVATIQCRHYGWDDGYITTQLEVYCVREPTRNERLLHEIKD